MGHSDAVWFHWMSLAVVIVANVSCNDSVSVPVRCGYRVHGIRSNVARTSSRIGSQNRLDYIEHTVVVIADALLCSNCCHFDLHVESPTAEIYRCPGLLIA